MRADFENDELVFSTGKRVYANNCVIGLCADGATYGGQLPSVLYGSDGCLRLPEDEWADKSGRLTPGECVELADEMLKRWAEFRARYAR